MAQRKIHDSASSRVMAYRKRRLEGMKRVEIWLTDEELEQLDRVAEQYGSSRARVVAQLLTGHAVQDICEPEPLPTEPPLLPSPEPSVPTLSMPLIPPERTRAERSKAVFLASLRTLAPGG